MYNNYKKGYGRYKQVDGDYRYNGTKEKDNMPLSNKKCGYAKRLNLQHKYQNHPTLDSDEIKEITYSKTPNVNEVKEVNSSLVADEEKEMTNNLSLETEETQIQTETYSLSGRNHYFKPESKTQNKNQKEDTHKNTSIKSQPQSDAHSSIRNIYSDQYGSKPTIAPTSSVNRTGRKNKKQSNKMYNKNKQVQMKNETLSTLQNHEIEAIKLIETQNNNEGNAASNSELLQIKKLFLQDTENMKQNAKDVASHIKHCDHLNCDLTSLQEKLTSIVHTVDQCKIVIAFFLLLVTLLLFNPILFFILVLILSLFIGFLSYEYYQCQLQLQSIHATC